MFKFHYTLLLVGLMVACSDQAQTTGEGRRGGNNGPADTSRPDGKQDSSNATDDRRDDDRQDNTDRDEGSNNDGDRPTGLGCNFDFADELESPISASGSAEAPLIGNINFDLEADASIEVSAATTKAKVGLDANITSFSPSLARSIADKVVASYRDPLKLTIVAPSKLADFYQSTPGWKDLDCVVIPVTRVENNQYEYEFDPALPMIIDPSADRDTIEKALARTVSISGITSKLIRHYQPNNVATRGEYEGSAKISSSGGAYEISYDFGQKAPEALATPMAGITFDLGSDRGKFDSITITSFVSDNSKVDLKITK